jgi:hypothetical protein
MSKKEHSPTAYRDVQLVMDMAVKRPGLQYHCKSLGAAINFKQRCNRYRNLKRAMAQELVADIPGQRAETIYDVLVIRQVNASGEYNSRSPIIQFDHHEPQGRLIDPETGEEIDILGETRSLFDPDQ